MKFFIQLLRYTNKLRMRVIWFVLASSLGTIFGAFNIMLVIPMLSVLFNQENKVAATLPDGFIFSSDYLVGIFNYYFQFIIHTYGKLDALLFICALIVLSIFLANVFRFTEQVIAIKIKTDLVRNLRLDLFNNVFRLHIGFFQSHKKGDIISRFTNDINEVELSLIEGLKSLLREPITIIIYFAILFSLSAKLTFFTLIMLPVTGGALAELIKRLKKAALQHQESLGRIVSIIDETFGGIRIVKAFNAEGFISRKMTEESDYYRKISKSMSYKNQLASPVSEVLGTVIVVVIIFFGGSMVLADAPQLEPNVFLGFLALFAMLIQPIKNFSNSITKVQKAKVSAKRIFEVMEIEPAIRNKANMITFKQFEKNIELRNVCFAYESAPVLKDVSLCLEKGKTIALVGPSGGGKSTLVDLISRFYDPTAGEILLDGKPLADYEIASVRQQIGVVSQESILFHDTVFNNIAFGLPHASEALVMQAAKVANAHHFIMQMEKGYQTMIGERGTKLSGGQKQRLSIARAVLKNPPILILDEATSALDVESEKLVQEALFNLMQNRTSLIIAHRLSTIQSADEIMVVQEGKIAERGTHDDLEKLNGIYKKMITLQSVNT